MLKRIKTQFRLSDRERKIFAICILVIIGSLIHVLGLEPLILKYQHQKVEVLRKEKEFLKLSRVFLNREGIESEYKRFKEKIGSEISDEEAVSKFLKEIENLTRKARLQIISMKPSSVKERDLYKESLIEMETEGNISNLARFLYELEKVDKFLKVKRLQVNSISRASSLKIYLMIGKILTTGKSDVGKDNSS